MSEVDSPQLEDYDNDDLIQSVDTKVFPERTSYYDNIIKAITDETYQGEVKTAAISAAQLESTTNSNLLSEFQMRKMYPYATPISNPLTYDFLARVHDNIRRDGAPRRCIKTITQFMLGRRQKPMLAVAEEYYSEDEEQFALNAIQQDPINKEVITQLCEIDKTVKARKQWKTLIFKGLAYGRSVLVKQYDNELLPKKLIPLASLRLGSVWVDRRDWTFLGVEYLDYNTSQRILQAPHIIHYEYDDIPLTPNAMYFGMPLLEGLTALIESNRITSEVVIPELSKKAFAPQQIIVVPDAKSKEKLAEIAALVVPGKTTVLRKMIDLKTIDLVVDILMQTQKLKDVDQKVFRDSGVPLGIGFPSEPNKATFDEELNQWTEGQLTDMRTDLGDVLEPQWYIPNAKQLWANGKVFEQATAKLQMQQQQANPMQQEQPFQMPRTIIPKIEKASTDLWWEPLTTNERLNATNIKLPFDVKVEYTNIVIEGFVEKAAAIVAYINANVITPQIGLELAGLDRYKEEMMTSGKLNMINDASMFQQEIGLAAGQLQGVNFGNVGQMIAGQKPKNQAIDLSQSLKQGFSRLASLTRKSNNSNQ